MDSVEDIEAWRLVQIKPNCLHIAHRNLQRQGFRVFCPLEETTRRRAGRFVTIEAPLFPGYLFLGVNNDSAPMRVVNSTYGVSRIVSFSDDAPAEVPRAIIDGLMARCNENGLLKPIESLTPGDEVRITTGPFADFVGKVETISGEKRVWVLLDLLGGSTKVALQKKNVQKT